MPVAPILNLGSHEETANKYKQLRTLEGSDKTIYLVKHPAPHQGAELVYLSTNQSPKELAFSLNELGTQAPPKYGLLLLVPVAVPIDAATLPLQISFLALLMCSDFH